MAPYLTQLRGLMWRNLLIKKRGWKLTVLEVLSPVVLVVAMIIISIGVDTNITPVDNDFSYHNFTPSIFLPTLSGPILASPDLPLTSDVMGYVTRSLKNAGGFQIATAGNVTSTKLEESLPKDPDKTLVGVELLLANRSQGLQVHGYVLRVPHEMVRDVLAVGAGCAYSERMGKCGNSKDGLTFDCPASQVLTSGLLSLQWAVETALIQRFHDPSFTPPELQLQMMPLPAFRPGTTHTQVLMCVSMVIAMTPLAFFVTVAVVREKKSGSKAMLRSMGIKDSVFWLSWWIPYVVETLLIAVLSTILVALGGFLGSSGLGVFFLLVILYGASVVGFSFIVANFFQSPKIAGLVTAILTIMLGLLYLAISLTRSFAFTLDPVNHVAKSELPFGVQLFFSFFSPVAFALGLDRAMHDSEEGRESDFLAGEFQLVVSVLVLIADVILYFVIAVYLDNVLPSKRRLTHKPWFFLTISYWQGHEESEEILPTDTPEGPHVEPPTQEMLEATAIRVRDLSKQYNSFFHHKSPVFGLNGLDLDIYEGQVTCILGHPGSGKTTLLNTISGIAPATNGIAFIYDLDACNVSSFDALTSTVAIVPQHDVLQEDQSVDEHMRIAAFLRGISAVSLEPEIEACLEDVQLLNERHKTVKELSGCQKRRLSLALALLANSKVLLLDEPTLGMGLEHRHRMWEMLHSKKTERVIVFTSRHMEEADFFADRKAVLSTGRLRCVGSSLFLKHRFNAGYQLHVTIRPGTSSEKLLRVMKSHVRGSHLIKSEDNRMTISIPHSMAGRLPGLLKRLESKDRSGGESMGLLTFAVNMTTLNQIFWRLETEDIRTSVAEEEEAGNVFISPLLTPTDDVFVEAETDQEELRRRESALRPSMVRSSTSERLEELAKRFSLHSSLHSPQDNGIASLFPRPGSYGVGDNKKRPVSFQRSTSDPEARPDREQRSAPSIGENSRRASGRKIGKMVRSMTSFFIPSAQHHESPIRSRSSSGDSIHEAGNKRVRHNSDTSKPHHKSKKDRSKSFGIRGLTRNRTSEALYTTSESQVSFETERPMFKGLDIPQAVSMAERKSTMSAFNEIKRSVSIHSMSGLSYLNDSRTTEVSSSVRSTPTGDPLAKVLIIDEHKREVTNKKVSSLSMLVSQTIHETSFIIDPVHASINGTAPPPKFGDALASLGPELKGWRLEKQRWLALLKVRALLLWHDKCDVFVRLFVPIVLTVIAVALSHATTTSTIANHQEAQHPLSGLQPPLYYKNDTGDAIDSLLSRFVKTSLGVDGLTQYRQELWDANVSVESLLDVLQSNGSAYKLYYNASCPLSLSRLTSVVAHVMRDRSITQGVNTTDGITLAANVSAYLQPWPPVTQEEEWGTLHWVPVLFLGLALLITPCSYAARMLRERKKGIRTYLNVTGVRPITYYGTAFCVDAMEFFVSAIILVIICSVSNMAMFETEGSRGCLVLLMFLSVPVGILWAYVASFAFTRPRTCLFFLAIILVLLTSCMFILVNFLDFEGDLLAAHDLHYIFAVLWPPYIRFGGLHFISQTAIGGREQIPASSFFDFSADIDICFIMMAIDIVVLSLLVLLLDMLLVSGFSLPCMNQAHRCKHEKPKQRSASFRSYGGDVGGSSVGVEKEVQRIHDLEKVNSSSWPLVVVNGLTKLFTDNKKQLRAVDNTSFVIQKGEVLCLLGPHDSGKSTVLNAVLGVCPFSEGSICLDSTKLNAGQSPSRLRGKIGYCPQHNPVWENLTLDQHVRLVGELRGLCKKDTDNVRNSLFHDLDLSVYRSSKAGKLSDSEKRKLTFAMSMLGKQNVLVIDDPSAGMDQRSRQLYWDAMNYFIRVSQRGAIVSTRCVEEAQALSSRLAVFVNGQLRCLGTKAELQDLCEKTYWLEIWLRGWDVESGPRRMEMLVMFLRELFPDIRLKEQFMNRAVFTVNMPSAGEGRDPDFSFAKTFDTIESIRRNLDLEDFTFSQATLDQIFLDLARDQHQGDGKFISDTDTIADSTTVVTDCTDAGDRRLPDIAVDIQESGLADPLAQERDEMDRKAGEMEKKGSRVSFTQDSAVDADAAGGVVIFHRGGDESSGGVAGVEESEDDGEIVADAGAGDGQMVADAGAGDGQIVADAGAGDGQMVADAGAAAPIVFEVGEGLSNPAYSSDEEDGNPLRTQL